MPTTPPADIDTITLGGMDALIVVDAPFRFGIDARGPSRTVTYQVEGGSAAQFCDALMGIGLFASIPFGWPLPHRYPNNTALICERVEGVPIGGMQPDAQLMKGDLANIVADYAIPHYDVYGEQSDAVLGTPVPWSSLETHGSLEQISVKPDGLVVRGDVDTALDSRTTIEIVNVEYIFRRMMLPKMVDFDSICKGLAGGVNDGAFFNCARGTLRFESWNSRRENMSDGTWVQEFTVVLRWREIEHNYGLVAGKLNTFGAIEDDDGDRKYLYKDFTPLVSYGVIP